MKTDASMTFETLLLLYGDDWKKSRAVYTELERRHDINGPLPGYSGECEAVIGMSHAEIDDAWRRVRDLYQAVRAEYEIIDERSPFFRERLLESEFPVPFLYAIGNVQLLEKERLTVLGSACPSPEAEADIRDTAAFMHGHKLALMTPLAIGVPSLMLGEVMKESGNVIAVSDHFVTKAPNERLKTQMIDIMKRGGLIISPFGPASRPERWHQVIRNRALSGLSDRLFLIEEKDGGPSWRIFDEASGDEVVKMCSVRNEGLEHWNFSASRTADGSVLRYEKPKDLKNLLPKRERRVRKWEDSETPSLF